MSLARSKLALTMIVSPPTSSRSKRGRSCSSPKRSCIRAGSSKTRWPSSRGRSSATSSPRTSTAGCRGFPLSKRASRRSASRSGRRMERLPRERRGRQDRNPRLGVEDRDGQRALADVEPELDAPATGQALGREPGSDARLARGRVLLRGGGEVHRRARRATHRERARLRRHRRRVARATAPVASTNALQKISSCVRRLRQRRRHRWVVPRLTRARLIADADEQRRDVLAMLSPLLKGGTRTARFDAGRRELDRDGVRLRVGGADRPAGRRVLDRDVLDRPAAKILEAAQEGARAEQPPQPAIAERGELVRDGRQGSSSLRLQTQPKCEAAKKRPRTKRVRRRREEKPR